jgi:protein-disulfide isomerase
MVDAKKIGVAGAAIVLVTLVAVFATSYMSDFETPRNSSLNNADESKAVELKGAPVLGSKTATVTIVEVGDYQCHMCKLWFKETRPLIIENYVETGKANLVFIDMPFLGRDSTPASEATYCANDQGKYWEYHSTLFEYQQEIDDGWANASRLQAIALNLGLDMEQFDKCMITDDHRAQVNANMQMAKKQFGANSTPTFVIVGPTGEAQKIVGAHPYSTFVSVLDPML